SALARQFVASSGSGFRFGLIGTTEKSCPSETSGQGELSPYLTEKIGPEGAENTIRSPLFDRFPTNWPAIGTAGYFSANCSAFATMTLNSPGSMIVSAGKRKNTPLVRPQPV